MILFPGCNCCTDPCAGCEYLCRYRTTSTAAEYDGDFVLFPSFQDDPNYATSYGPHNDLAPLPHSRFYYAPAVPSPSLAEEEGQRVENVFVISLGGGNLSFGAGAVSRGFRTAETDYPYDGNAVDHNEVDYWVTDVYQLQYEYQTPPLEIHPYYGFEQVRASWAITCRAAGYALPNGQSLASPAIVFEAEVRLVRYTGDFVPPSWNYGEEPYSLKKITVDGVEDRFFTSSSERVKKLAIVLDSDCTSQSTLRNDLGPGDTVVGFQPSSVSVKLTNLRAELTIDSATFTEYWESQYSSLVASNKWYKWGTFYDQFGQPYLGYNYDGEGDPATARFREASLPALEWNATNLGTPTTFDPAITVTWGGMSSTFNAAREAKYFGDDGYLPAAMGDRGGVLVWQQSSISLTDTCDYGIVAGSTFTFAKKFLAVLLYGADTTAVKVGCGIPSVQFVVLTAFVAFDSVNPAQVAIVTERSWLVRRSSHQSPVVVTEITGAAGGCHPPPDYHPADNAQPAVSENWY